MNISEVLRNTISNRISSHKNEDCEDRNCENSSDSFSKQKIGLKISFHDFFISIQQDTLL